LIRCVLILLAFTATAAREGGEVGPHFANRSSHETKSSIFRHLFRRPKATGGRESAHGSRDVLTSDGGDGTRDKSSTDQEQLAPPDSLVGDLVESHMAVGAPLVLALWVILSVPTTPFEVWIGYASPFRLWFTFLLVYAGKLIGCIISFALGRAVLRKTCTRRFESNNYYRVFHLLASKEPYTLCFLVRVSYLPIAVKNYALAVLSVELKPWLLALFAIEVPNTLIILYVGSTASVLAADQTSGTGSEYTLSVLSQVVSCVSLILLACYTSRHMNRTLERMTSDKELNNQEDGLTVEAGEFEPMVEEAKECAKECIPPALSCRLRQEVHLFLDHLPVFALCWSWWYVVCPLAMNVAYYRYEAGPRLRDAGFELLPELPIRYRFLSEFPFKVLGACAVLMGFVAQVPHPDGKTQKYYLFNALRRFSVVFAIGHTLRAMTFLSTTLPGVAQQCMPDFDWRANQPKKPFGLFPGPGFPSKSCGDLIFSGHMLVTTCTYLIIYKYARNMLGCSLLVYRAVMVYATLMWITQAGLIVMSRNHYTVDVVVASYLVPLLWHAHETWAPTEKEPSDEYLVTRLRRCVPFCLRRWKRVPAELPHLRRICG